MAKRVETRTGMIMRCDCDVDDSDDDCFGDLVATAMGAWGIRAGASTLSSAWVNLCLPRSMDR